MVSIKNLLFHKYSIVLFSILISFFILFQQHTFNIPGNIKSKILSNDPLIMEFENFLTDSESEKLIEIAKPILNRSSVSSIYGREVSTVRTSSSAYLTNEENSPFLSKIRKRAADLVNLPAKNVETLQVVNYKKGQEYKAHHDYFYPNIMETTEKGKGQRRFTFFVYLNDLEKNAGGETYFPELGLKVIPKKNKAVFFVDSDEDLNVDSRTLHQGSVVEKGEKWGLNIWIRNISFSGNMLTKKN